jgi:hypothetical protein
MLDRIVRDATFGQARDQVFRTPGLDPSSAAYQHNMMGLNLVQAATDATQQNAARQNVRDTAYARKQSALGLGKGLDTTAAAGMNSAAANSMGLANMAYGQSAQQAQALGNLGAQVVNGLNGTGTNASTNNNWLGSGISTAANVGFGSSGGGISTPGLAYGLNSSGSSVGGGLLATG